MNRTQPIQIEFRQLNPHIHHSAIGPAFTVENINPGQGCNLETDYREAARLIIVTYLHSNPLKLNFSGVTGFEMVQGKTYLSCVFSQSRGHILSRERAEEIAEMFAGEADVVSRRAFLTADRVRNLFRARGGQQAVLLVPFGESEPRGVRIIDAKDMVINPKTAEIYLDPEEPHRTPPPPAAIVLAVA